MHTPSKTYIKAAPRHVRFLIFVHHTISEHDLVSLFEANQDIWGGRYNPIIPVCENKISQTWIQLIKIMDPDYICHTDQVDPDYIRSLGLFKPFDYISIKSEPVYTSSFYNTILATSLLHDQLHINESVRTTRLINISTDVYAKLSANQFLKINFGWKPRYNSDKYEMKLDSFELPESEINSPIRFTLDYHLYYNSLLSGLLIDTAIPIIEELQLLDRAELILYSKKTFLDDFLYFWNRQLYCEPSNLIRQLLCSEDDIACLLNDDHFKHLLKKLSINNQFNLVSVSVPEDKLKFYLAQIQALKPEIILFSLPITGFPYQPSSIKRIKVDFFNLNSSLILGNTDMIRIPVLTFLSGLQVDRGDYMLDLEIEHDINDEHKEIMFPSNAALVSIIHKNRSRVNYSNNITVQLASKCTSVKITVPNNFELLNSILNLRMKDEKYEYLPVQSITFSPAGKKLAAFLDLFENNLERVNSYLKNKFWIQLFKNNSEFKNRSQIQKGKGVFHIKDLENEFRLVFNKYYSTRHENVDQEKIELNNDNELANKFKELIENKLAYLIKRNGILIGMKVSCEFCGSRKWYSLKDLSWKMNCSGCAKEIMPGIDSKIYYKISDTITNNILNNPLGNGKETEGNYIVLRTLFWLKYGRSIEVKSFIWTPCLDLISKNGIKTDIDLVVIINGKLILGEAKASGSEFTKPVLNNLLWVGDNLLPDYLILSCENGNLDSKVDFLKTNLKNKKCEILTYIINPPIYYFSEEE